MARKKRNDKPAKGIPKPKKEMSKNPNSTLRIPKSANSQFAALRKEAEEILKAKRGVPDSVSDMDFPELLHEFMVYQAELEIQNEELRTAQRRLEESQSKYADLYDFAPIGYFSLDKDGIILETNLTGAQLLGIERRRLVKKPFFLHISTSHKNVFFTHLKKVFESETKQICELKLKRKNGTEFFAQLESIPVKDSVGTNSQCRTAIVDITDRKQKENVLFDTSQRLYSVLNSISDGFFALDNKLVVTYFNKAAEQLLSRKSEIVLGRNLFDAFPEAKGSIFEEKYKKALKDRKPTFFVTFFGVKPYEDWYDVRVYPHKDGISVYFQIITERKRAENEIKRFASFPQLSPNPILEVDSSGTIVFCNAATVQALRKLNLGDTTLFLPNDLSGILDALEKEKEVQFYREVTIGDRIFGEVLCLTPQFNSIRIYANDITERKSYQEALKNALHESRQHEKEMSALSSASNAILKFTDFKSAARQIFDSCKQLIGATSGYIALLSKDGTENEVLFLDSGGLPCSVDPELPMPIRGLRGEAYQSVKTVYANNFPESQWLEFMPEGHVRLKNVLFAPLITDGKPLGLLGLANKTGGFTDNDARIASAFGDLAAIALTQKNAEEALRHSEEYFRAVTENASDVITILDAGGTIRYESHSVEQVLGYKQEELVGKSAFDLIHPDDLANVMDAFSQIIQKPGITLSDEFRSRHKDGSWRILSARGTNLLNDPAVKGIVVNSRDVTDRKQAEEALWSERQKLINILDSMVDGVYIVDQKYNIEYVNPEIEKEYGPVNGRSCHEYFEGQKEVCSWCRNREVFEGKTVRSEWYSSKTNKTYDLVNTPLENADGSISKLGIFRDITERKRAEEALALSEQHFRTMANAIPQLAWIANADGWIQWYNSRWYEYTGTTPAEMEGWGWQSVHDPDILPAVLERWKTSLATAEPFDMVFPLRGADGMFRPFLTRVMPLKDESGRVFLWFGTNTDISKQKQAEEALQKVNRTLKALSNSDHAMLQARSESDFLKDVCKIIVNDCGHAMVWIGFAEEDEGKTVRPVASAGFEEGYLKTLNITWADTERGKGPTGTAIRTSKPNVCRNMLTDPAFEPWRKEAIKRGYASSIVLPLLENGKAYGAINIYSKEPDPFTEDEVKLLSELAGDLSYGILAMRLRVAHAEAEEEIRRSEARLAAFAADTFESIVYSRGGRIADCNEQFARMTGYTLAEVLGREIADFLAPEDRDRVMANIRQGLHSEIEHAMIRKDGSRIIVEAHGRPDMEGPRGNRMTVLRDITERKQAEQELKKSREELAQRNTELEMVNKDLEAFSYAISHDLKSPLRSIQGFAQAITDDYKDRLDDEGKDFLRRITSASERMTQLIDSMLEISRLTSRDILGRSVDLSSIAEVIAYELKKNDPDRQVDFVIAKEVKAQGDLDMLEIVLRNLIDNAWKFTSTHATAKIEFGITNIDGQTVYFVRDDGAGFDMEFADKLFMPFKRLHAATEFSGLGIGLATARKIINKHGGKIWAESEREKGVTFYFTLE